MHVARLGVDDRDHTIRPGHRGHAPGSLFATRLDVLASDQGQQTNRLALDLLKRESIEGSQRGQGIARQGTDHGVNGFLVVPCTCRLARVVVVVVGAQLEGLGFGHQTAHPADLRHQLHEGVLAHDSVVEGGRVECPTVLTGNGPGLSDHLAHGIEDPLRCFARSQLVAPQGQHGRVEARVGQREAGGRLPGDVGAQPSGRVAIREAIEGLEHHDGRHHVGRNRGSSAPGGTQVGEHPVGEQLAPVVGQEILHTALGHQVATQGFSVEESTTEVRGSLHSPILVGQQANREHRWRLNQQAPN